MQSRRDLLKKITLGVVLVAWAGLEKNLAFAADAPLVTADDPTAKALKYVEDASKASGAKPGSKCANCALYQGATASKQGPCAIFQGKQVKAAGWCTSWSPQI
ncbi:MAG TPA: high-potential iron-sulfur protein [Spongiibacteraceae bacterium]|nr:high-potential iron-sulfur protein [Spongiibacteraceae bacterium]